MEAYYLPRASIVLVQPAGLPLVADITEDPVHLGEAEELDLCYGGNLYPMMGCYVNNEWHPVFFAREE